MSISDFLNARIAEDEAVARAAIDNVAPDEWESELGSLNLWPQDIAHWNRHDPARVLAECAAKRAIVASCGMVPSYEYDPATKLRDDILRTLAAVYADHEGYRDEWRVGASVRPRGNHWHASTSEAQRMQLPIHSHRRH